MHYDITIFSEKHGRIDLEVEIEEFGDESGIYWTPTRGVGYSHGEEHLQNGKRFILEDLGPQDYALVIEAISKERQLGMFKRRHHQ